MRAHKPGAEKRPFRPDTIVNFNVAEPSALMTFLMTSMPERKRTNIKELLKYDQIMVNGEVTRQFDRPVSPGDHVAVNLTRPFITFYHRRLQLVYEDDTILVVNKGYGLLSMGNDTVHEGTAYSILRDYLKMKNPANKLFIVHRLDQHTSGLMVFAKTIEAKEALQHNWNNMVLKRQYVCVVEGCPEQESGTIKSYLAENTQHIVYSTDDPTVGRISMTNYRVLSSANGYSLLEVELETGRKNQIRVHMKDLGHPIAGDRKYGAKTSPIHRLALHARTIRFIHPATRKLLDFSTPIPTAFQSMVKSSRKSDN